ncbi:MAG TPA: FAD-dependent monooxygenase [Mucilaginibacter sp.]|jgi:2-polyprenyl-6-methoxyphenol hydroxylase-like FAD-dependent oxidoreductase|nr:FAD-dependent monooxygenase [Mucilaginibacter sp.]
MVITETHTKVLIVGAGPSGLMMAAQLLRYGIRPIIIDSKQGPTMHSNALAVQARSLEIYRQLGLIDQILAGGKQAKEVAFNEDGKQVACLSFNNVGVGETLFPFVHIFQQNKNERLLLDFLTQHACPVYWETSLVSLEQNDKNARVELQNRDGVKKLTCDWVIGADGAHSSVRKLLLILFKGDTYQHQFYLADIEVANKQLGDEQVGLFLSNRGFAGFFPMPEPRRFRVVGNLPDELNINRDTAVLDDLLPYLEKVLQFPIELVQNHWFTVYRLHHRMADHFRKQRCFLIGDAAHIHSPVGGQGMNTGLQDAYNLAWKLAGVVNKRFNKTILDTYAMERMPVAKDLLSTTDKAFSLIMSGSWISSLFKKWILPGLLKMVWSKKLLREGFFKRVSQISISYRNSPLSLHLSNSAKIKAGDRLPYLKIYDEKKEEETDLHAWCSKPGFTLIILGKFDELFLFTLAKWITGRYSNTLNFFYLPPSGKNLDVFNAFEANPHQQMAIIVRPDMHIGFMNDKVDMVLMDNYLRNVAGIKSIVHAR